MKPNLRLKHERELRGWSQAKVAEAIGSDAITISRWERGHSFPYPFFREKLCILFEKSAIELGLIPESELGKSISGEVQTPLTQGIAPHIATKPVLDPTIPLMPVGITALIGRDALFAQLKQRIYAHESLALTALNGLPGVGKTALAIALANDQDVRTHYRDGILWAGLGPHPNIAALLGQWGRLLNISSDQVGDVTSVREWARAIRTTIGNKHMLLIIDDAWTEEDAVEFKIAGPNCAHLVTTRFPQIAIAFASNGAMTIPELDEDDGIALLARFAPQAIAQDPEGARTLVRSVGALPLALTLMGKYLRVQSHSGQPRRIQTALKHLHDAEYRLHISEPSTIVERHPGLKHGTAISLASVIAMSDEYLADKRLREAFYALSVFPAKPHSFSEEAALAVTQIPIEMLDKLYDTGLLESSGEGRYTLHQIVASYARSCLRDTRPYERLIAYGIDYIERQSTNYDALERESTLLVAALKAAYRSGSREDLVRGICAFAHFLQMRGVYALAERHLLQMYESATRLRDAASIASPLLHLGMIMETWGEDAHIAAYLQEGLELAQAQGDVDRCCSLLTSLGWVTSEREDYVEAGHFYRQGLLLARQLNDNRRIGILLSGLSWVADKQGNYAEEEAYLREEMELANHEGDHARFCVLLTCLAWAIVKQGDYARAKNYGLESIALARELGDDHRLAILLASVGRIAMDWGDIELAEVCNQASLVLAQKIGDQELLCVDLGGKGWIVERKGHYKQSIKLYEEGLTIARQLGHKEILCRLLLGIGWVTYQLKDYVQTDTYLQEGLHLAREIGSRELICRQVTILGNVAKLKGDYLQAEKCYMEGLTLARQLGYQLSGDQLTIICSTLYVLGEIRIDLGKYDDALSAFNELIILMPKEQYNQFAKAHFGLARALAASNKIKEAREAAQISLAAFETSGHRSVKQVREWLEHLE